MRSSSSLCGKGSMIVVKQPISTTSRSGEAAVRSSLPQSCRPEGATQ
jgi:hypothetical protein